VTPTEQVERELFDVVAVTASTAVNTGDRVARKLSLRLIKEAMERSPASLHVVLREVLDLPPERLHELEQLLRRTTLSAIISAARVVANRLDFLRGLEVLLFEPENKKVLRSGRSFTACLPRRPGSSATSTRSQSTTSH
jgi:hypothetical protein